MKYLITIILTLVFQSISYAATVKDFTASYDLYHNEFFVGKSKRSLNTENKNLTFSSIAKTAGVAAWFFDITITEISKLRFKNKRLNFVSYSYNEKNSDKNKGYQLYLDKTHNFYNTHTKQLYPAAKNLHDTLGFTVAIMQDLQAGKRNITYTIAEKSKLKKYTLKFIKKENLATDKGEISTLKMEHYNPKTKRRFTFWCADKMNFLPVRIRKINYKGNEDLLNLTHFNQQPIALSVYPEEEEE